MIRLCRRGNRKRSSCSPAQGYEPISAVCNLRRGGPMDETGSTTVQPGHTE